ncbi:maltose operon protein MalM [Gallibacterium genomosp. 1]|uniref:Maltose operon protein n=1 Tax=Gallibacterium genomosp. 1 TaxID=155515 RepID=A0A0A2YLN2_9PAST|nr:maltose operon protein MalM [Gallibacterium genomosp. 1]KGQ38229.1 maltose operon protein [Gallibacterium genomosp. 1]
MKLTQKTRIFLTALFATALSTQPTFAATLSLPAQSLAQLHWQDVALPQQVKTELNATQKQGFTLSFAGIESPVAAYRLPASQGTMEIEIESEVQNQHVFVPNVVVLDSQFQVAAHYDSTYFKLQEERGLKPNRLAAKLNLTPINQGALYLLIYTTKADLAGQTIVPHPSKLFAKATGKQPPAIADIQVKHSLNGKLIVNFQPANGTHFVGLNQIFTMEKNAPAATAVIANQKGENEKNVKVEKETEAYFNQAVLNALKQKDINRALNLVNEAEKLGLRTPRKLFLQQVSAK